MGQVSHFNIFPPAGELSKPAYLACAVFYGEVRLIDYIALAEL